MSGGVTTGSILNSRVYGQNSSKKGVQSNSLLKTKITLAGRSRSAGGASYTSLSRSINGRAVVIKSGQGGCCHGASNKMSTMEKIAMWNAIAQSSLQLGQGIGALINSFKSNKSTETVSPQKASKQQSTIEQPQKTTVQQSVQQTLADLGMPDVSLLGIDTNYEKSADDLIKEMKGAKTSADLYKALSGAKAYKQQIDSRIAGFGNIKELQDQLNGLNGSAEGSVKKAKTNFDDAKKTTDDLKGTVTQGKTQVDSARQSYDAARQALEGKNQAYDDASKAVNTKLEAYDNAKSDLAGKRQSYSQAKMVTAECAQSLTTAKANKAQAQADLDALLAQQGSATDGAALQAQIAKATQARDKAKLEEEQAQKALDKAQEAENKAQSNVSLAEQNCESARGELVEARNALNTQAKALKDSKAITNDQYELLTNRQNSLDTAEATLQENETKLADAEQKQVEAEAQYEKLKATKEELEVKIADYNEMQKASKKLGDLSDYETKLNDLMKKEGTKREDLTKKMNAKNTTSNTADSAKARTNAENRETALTDQRVALNAGDATVAMASDKKMQISHSLDQMASLTNLGLSNGISNKMTINGHTVEYKNYKYYVDGSENGMDKTSAMAFINTSFVPKSSPLNAFNQPFRPTV